MGLAYTQTFVDAYHGLDSPDADAVDAMLDRLEAEHLKPRMRNGVMVGRTLLYATPRFEAPSGTYRITWKYDEGSEAITPLCITVAQAPINFPI